VRWAVFFNLVESRLYLHVEFGRCFLSAIGSWTVIYLVCRSRRCQETASALVRLAMDRLGPQAAALIEGRPLPLHASC